MGMTHSEGLMPQLEQLLTRTKITKNEIDLLAVSMGPGSFTGLRIGLASAEAMAYSWHKPICGVNTLKALAYNLPIDGYVLSPVLDAQKGNFYQAIYEWQQGTLIEHQEIKVVDRKLFWVCLLYYWENARKLTLPICLHGAERLQHIYVGRRLPR